MSRKIQLLPGGKYLFGGVLYKSGAILPDTKETRELVNQKRAVLIDDESDDKQPGGYGARTVKDLFELAKERGIEVPTGTKKDGFIELLTAWDTEHAADDGPKV